MAMINLDSGDYVNTDYIERLWMINEHDGFIRFVNTPDVPISENDRGRIVKAMKPKIMLKAKSDGNDDLPVIPKAVGEYIEEVKAHGKFSIIYPLWRVSDALRTIGESVLGDRYRWVLHHSDDFARALVLGVWRVEETGEIVKLEEA